MKQTKPFKACWWLPLVFMLAACQSSSAPSVMKTVNPKYDLTYDKTGEASWYGNGFQGKDTASGEKFDQNALTAAHPTLPMRSLVRVTNLANGRSLIIRINDRGPFGSGRIIDLSKRSAHDLGIRSTGRVRVQFLKEETDQYLASLQDNSK